MPGPDPGAGPPQEAAQDQVLAQTEVNAISFSGELRGELMPCDGCGGGPGLGAQAAWLDGLARGETRPLLVDGGNSLFGGDGQLSGGAAVADALEVLGYDLVHISYRDLRMGLQATRSLLADRSFTALSANLVDEETDQPIFTPWVQRDVAGNRVAFIGLCEVPAALPYSTDLRAQLAGVRIAPPQEAFSKYLPEVRAGSDQVVLVFYGSARSLTRVLAAAPSDVDLVLLAGGRGGPKDVPCAVTEAGGGAVELAALGPTGWEVARHGLTPVEGESPSALNEALAAVLAQHGLQPAVTEAAGPARTLRRPPPGEARGLAGVDLAPEEVNRAIDEGREALKKIVKQMGGWEGKSDRRLTIAAYALLSSAPEAERSTLLREIEPMVRGMLYTSDTYQLSILVQLALKVGLPSSEIETLLRRLVDDQRSDGAWDYACNARSPSPTTGPVATPTNEGGIRRRGDWGVDQGQADSSITQFALLGLRAAERAGFDVADEVWERAAQHFVRTQAQDGGWGYRGSKPRGSMTCAGISSLTLCRHSLGDSAARESAEVSAAMGWLDRNFSVTEHPPLGFQHLLYYLYSLERIGAFLDTEFIGIHEWYPLGAKALVASQMSDGTWSENRRDSLVGTAFALLFLCRATEALEVDPTASGQLLVPFEEASEAPVYLVLDASGSMLAKTPRGTTRFEEMRAAALHWITRLSLTREIGVRVYGSRLRATEDGAERDSLLLVAPGVHSPEALSEAILGLRARGKTPLTFSLEEALKDLVRGDVPPRVILLSDGGDDTRARGGATGAAERLRGRTGGTIDVIGFTGGKGEAELRAIAEAGGGQYRAAADGSEEVAAMLAETIPTEPPQVDVIDSEGRLVGATPLNEPLTLSPGRYVLRTKRGALQRDVPFSIHPGRTTRVPLEP